MSCGRFLLVLALMGGLCLAEDEQAPPRLANGKILPGKVLQATNAGLEVETQRGPKTFPWFSLSAGTRYRLQPGFRERFEASLKSGQVKPPG